MRGQRLWHTLRLCTILSSDKRTEYYRKKKIFHSMGENCLIMNRVVPLYAKLISLGNNVKLASHVHFNTHDITHLMLNHADLTRNLAGGGGRFKEKLGCIEIGDNVFIGESTSINYNVKIGSNVIIGARSLVTKDIPDNSVAAGVPARVIMSFEDYLERRLQSVTDELSPWNEYVSNEVEEEQWRKFNKAKKKQT